MHFIKIVTIVVSKKPSKSAISVAKLAYLFAKCVKKCIGSFSIYATQTVIFTARQHSLLCRALY